MLHKGWCGMFLSGMVGAASGGTEKKYKITNKSGYIDCKAQQASAGETVPVSIRGSVRISIQTTSGLTIPTADGDISLYAPEIPVAAYFIMPREDIIISSIN